METSIYGKRFIRGLDAVNLAKFRTMVAVLVVHKMYVV